MERDVPGFEAAQDEEDKFSSGSCRNKKSQKPLSEAKPTTKPIAKKGAQGIQFQEERSTIAIERSDGS